MTHTKIERILSAHRILMESYLSILLILDNPDIKTPYVFTRTNPRPYLQDKKIGHYERLQIVVRLIEYYVSLLANRRFYDNVLKKIRKHSVEEIVNSPVTRNPKKRLVSYFFKTHMRRELEKIHKLYIQEIMIQNKDTITYKEMEELRKIDSDVLKYRDVLPNPKKILLAIIGTGVGTIIAIMEITGLKEDIVKSLQNFSINDMTQAFIISLLIGITILNILIGAFSIKRSLLLRSNSWYDYLDIYLGKGDDLYKKSIYKLENNLFEALEVKDKPKEYPIDLIFPVIVRGPILVFFAVSMITKIIENVTHNIPFPTLDQFFISGVSLVLIVFGFSTFIVPYLEYRRRKKYCLL